MLITVAAIERGIAAAGYRGVPRVGKWNPLTQFYLTAYARRYGLPAWVRGGPSPSVQDVDPRTAIYLWTEGAV